MYFYNFVFIFLWKKAWTFNMNKPKSSSPKDAFYHGLVEIGPVVLEKIFKFNVYSLFRTYLPLEKDGPLRLYKFEYPSPKYLIRSKFAWNLPTDSGKEDFKIRQCIFAISLLSPLEKGKVYGQSFEQKWITFTQWCFVLS